MGAGLAKEFRSRFGMCYEAYREMCKKGIIDIGSVGYLNIKEDISNIRILLIVYFPTKYHYLDKSVLQYIESGLNDFVNTYADWMEPNTKIAFPMLGCGLGGLKKKDVLPIMIKYLKDLPIIVEIWNPKD